MDPELSASKLGPFKENIVNLKRRFSRVFPTLFALVLGMVLIGPGAQAGDEADLARELLEGTDDMHRGESSHATMTMHVKTSRYERSMTMEAWSQGEEKSLMIIRSPAKEAGTATLKVDNNIWNYLPKVDRTMKVPAGMMGGSWMGSHFTNDDLIKESRMADDYTYSITERPKSDAEGDWVIQLTPKPDAPVVWGKVVVTIRAIDRLATSITYWDEKNVLKRTMAFEDIKPMGGRTIASRMRLIPEDKPGEFTEIIYENLEFNVEIPASKFTIQGLKK